jgi:hypothetical protein
MTIFEKAVREIKGYERRMNRRDSRPHSPTTAAMLTTTEHPNILSTNSEIMDGISSALESYKSLNPEPLKDSEWRIKMRNYLPPELAALRQPHADPMPAVRVIESELKQAVEKEKLQNQRRRRTIN